MTTLVQANAVTPMMPPAGADLEEQREFYQGRADMYREVAKTDPRHYWEAMACAGLEQERADLIADNIRRSKTASD
ncbi:AMED_5909 family protein [Actinocrispum sp. NPDC049592]|uniref:AMED_5909 family protein n=1 Tax=Actinocrispum sp. NPDC049592 TaxID=3154835 RepID=UPI003425F9AD